jgi:hypothetical protein
VCSNLSVLYVKNKEILIIIVEIQCKLDVYTLVFAFVYNIVHLDPCCKTYQHKVDGIKSQLTNVITQLFKTSCDINNLMKMF